MQIGAQLYTANKRLTTLEDFGIGLKKVADIGYRSVQVSGTCDYDPVWLRDRLQENGLTCAMTHIDADRLINETEKVVAEHAIYGCRNIGLGSIPLEQRGRLEGYEQFRDTYLPVARKIRDLGAVFHYHNHRFEFEDLAGKNMLERMLEDFPEDSLEFTLDLGWVAAAGADVLQWIDLLKGRISRIHLKDYADMPADGSITTPAYLRPIYEGKLPYDDYIRALKKAGTEYILVEQDWCYGEDEFDCLRRSYMNVTSRFPETK